MPYLAGLIFDTTAPELGTANRTSAMFAAPYVDPCPQILQPPGEEPFTDIRPLRPEVGVVWVARLPDWRDRFGGGRWVRCARKRPPKASDPGDLVRCARKRPPELDAA